MDKIIHVKESTYKRLCERRMGTNTINNIIEQALDSEEEYEEIKDLIQADIAYVNNKDIIRFKSIEELDKFFSEER